MAWRYSAVQNIALYVAVLPLIFAVLFADTLDWYPYFICAGVGVVLTFVLRGALGSLRGRLRRSSAAFVAGEVPAEHAPGGFVLWLAPPLWCVALGLLANAYLDRSPPAAHASEVLRRTSPSKGPGSYILRGIRLGEPELSIRANSLKVTTISEGQAVTIVVRAGLFGWARIESISPRP